MALSTKFLTFEDCFPWILVEFVMASKVYHIFEFDSWFLVYLSNVYVVETTTSVGYVTRKGTRGTTILNKAFKRKL